MASTFWTCQVPKVLQSSCVFSILTSKRASRHNGVHFFNRSTALELESLTLWLGNVLRAILGFPKIGVPPVIIHFHGIFPNKNHPANLGVPWKTPYASNASPFDQDLGLATNAALASKPKLGLPMGGSAMGLDLRIYAKMFSCTFLYMLFGYCHIYVYMYILYTYTLCIYDIGACTYVYIYMYIYIYIHMPL